MRYGQLICMTHPHFGDGQTQHTCLEPELPKGIWNVAAIIIEPLWFSREGLGHPGRSG